MSKLGRVTPVPGKEDGAPSSATSFSRPTAITSTAAIPTTTTTTTTTAIATATTLSTGIPLISAPLPRRTARLAHPSQNIVSTLRSTLSQPPSPVSVPTPLPRTMSHLSLPDRLESPSLPPSQPKTPYIPPIAIIPPSKSGRARVRRRLLQPRPFAEMHALLGVEMAFATGRPLLTSGTRRLILAGTLLKDTHGTSSTPTPTPISPHLAYPIINGGASHHHRARGRARSASLSSTSSGDSSTFSIDAALFRPPKSPPSSGSRPKAGGGELSLMDLPIPAFGTNSRGRRPAGPTPRHVFLLSDLLLYGAPSSPSRNGLPGGGQPLLPRQISVPLALLSVSLVVPEGAAPPPREDRAAHVEWRALAVRTGREQFRWVAPSREEACVWASEMSKAVESVKTRATVRASPAHRARTTRTPPPSMVGTLGAGSSASAPVLPHYPPPPSSTPLSGSVLIRRASSIAEALYGGRDSPDAHRSWWVQDEAVSRCMLQACPSPPFGVWLRRHHCRRCGRIICFRCSRIEGVRVCLDCSGQPNPIS